MGLFAAAAAAQPSDNPSRTVTQERACEDFCHQLFGADDVKSGQCVQGCQTAARCIERCNERFADDAEKLKRCNYNCARGR